MSDEKKKVLRFQRGLKVSIRTKIVLQGLESFTKALSTARLIERDLEDLKQQGLLEHRGKGKATSSHPRAKRDEPKRKRPAVDERRHYSSLCRSCGKDHAEGPCRRLTGACFKCGDMGHMIRDCPKMRSQPQQARGADDRRPRAQGRVYAVTRKEAQNAPAAIEGMISVSNGTAYVLFDYGSKHSFVSPKYVRYLSAKPEALEQDLLVRTPRYAYVLDYLQEV